MNVVELKRFRPDDVDSGVYRFEPWVHHNISSDYGLKVLEISFEYGLEVTELDRIGQDDIDGGINQFERYLNIT